MTAPEAPPGVDLRGLLYPAGSSLGVRLSAGTWLHMTELSIVGLVPFAALASRSHRRDTERV